MIYNLDNQLERSQFLSRAAHLAEKGGAVEMTLKRPYTDSTNNYLHAIIGYFALQYGETLEYCKREFFKAAANADTFAEHRISPIRGRHIAYRSIKSLSQEELSLCIDRFRNWAGKTYGLYLPDPDDYAALEQIDIELKKNKEYL